MSDYNTLMKSIDFFSQNLSFEQIMTYGYTYIHNALELKHSAIYVIEENSLKLNSQIACTFKTQNIPYDNQLKRIATRLGRTLQKELPEYFSDDFINGESVCFGIPIIVRDDLVGIIFSKDDINLENHETATFYNGMNQLINKACESAINFKKFQNTNAELDRKIYNLLFINHSTKALMAEINIDKLYNLCIDVVREITASAVTSFGLYDEIRESIVLKGYSDIISFSEYYTEIKLRDKNESINKVCYNVKEDFEELGKIFECPEKFIALKAEYVVLIVKDEIIGFVTIGEPVSGKKCSRELLKQIESLASSIYIAITNAQYINTIEKQEKEVKSQLESLKQLGNAIKNINSCNDVNEVCTIALQSLAFDFDIKKSLLILNEKGTYRVYASIGIDIDQEEFVITDKFRSDCFTSTYYEGLSGVYSKYVSSDLIAHIEDSNCFVSIPLLIDEISTSNEPLGYIIAFDTDGLLTNSKILLMETLASSISPIIKHLGEKEILRKHFIPNEEVKFLEHIESAIKNRDEFYTDFSVLYKRVPKLPFEVLETDEYESLKLFHFSNILLHISYDDKINKSLFDGEIVISELDEIYEEIKSIV